MKFDLAVIAVEAQIDALCFDTLVNWGEAVNAAEADKGNEVKAKKARELGGETQALAMALAARFKK